MLRLTFRVLVLLATFTATQVWAAPSSPFPDLVDIEGNPVTTESDVGNGKWSLVMIWATDCHVCTVMKPKISAFHDKHKKTIAEVYGIALDGRKNVDVVKQYMLEHKVTFPTYVGEIDMIAVNLEINTQTPLRGTPTYLLFGPTGELMAIDYGMLDVNAIERFIERNS